MNKDVEDFYKQAEESLEGMQGAVHNKDHLIISISMSLLIAYKDGIIEGMDRAGEIFRST